MSLKLGATMVAMVILVGAMGIKTAVTPNTKGAVLMANGPAPPPLPIKSTPGTKRF
jgi:hypothetical protein